MGVEVADLRKNELPLFLPEDPIKAWGVKVWAAEKGITLLPGEIQPTDEVNIGLPKKRLDTPKRCKNGHYTEYVYLKRRPHLPTRPVYEYCCECYEAAERRRQQLKRTPERRAADQLKQREWRRKRRTLSECT